MILVALLCFAGCRNKKKDVLTQSDLPEEIIHDSDVDWIGLYIRCHELDSIKNVAEAAARKAGQPMLDLPDSVPELWNSMMGNLLMRNGDNAFATFDSHRKDIADYLRLDFINYGFITKVYLPYKAMKSTREEYGDICIKELENEFDKAQLSIYYNGVTPSHYENMLMDMARYHEWAPMRRMAVGGMHHIFELWENMEKTMWKLQRKLKEINYILMLKRLN